MFIIGTHMFLQDGLYFHQDLHVLRNKKKREVYSCFVKVKCFHNCINEYLYKKNQFTKREKCVFIHNRF